MSELDIRPVRRFGANARDRQQGQGEIEHLPEQAIQRSLIDHRASEDGCSVACVAEAQARKPLGPPLIEVALEANFVPSAFVAERLVLDPRASPPTPRVRHRPPPPQALGCPGLCPPVRLLCTGAASARSCRIQEQGFRTRDQGDGRIIAKMCEDRAIR